MRAELHLPDAPAKAVATISQSPLISPDKILTPLAMLWFGSEIVLSRVRRAKAEDQSHDRSSLAWIWIVIIISIFAGVYVGRSHIGPELDSDLMKWSGIALIVGGLIFRWVAILSLGKMFTVDVAITQSHKLVQTGLYKKIRHPSYTGSLFSFLGFGIAQENFLSLALIFIPIFAMFLIRIHVEEKALMSAFGEEYAAYRKATWGLVPGVY